MTRRTWIPLAVLLSLGLGFGALERGNRLYRAGRYAEAVEAYREALRDGETSPQLHYNLGTALLATGERAEAERYLRLALGGSDAELRRRAYYNLGNRFLTEARAGADAEAARPLLDAAAEAYKQALRIEPTGAAAKWNLELALREREQQPRSPQSGAGSEDEENEGDPSAGGGGSGDPDEGPPSPAEPSPGETRNAPLAPDQADRILNAAEQDERELYRDKLRKGPRARPTLRDW